jgi:hypothetical protein
MGTRVVNTDRHGVICSYVARPAQLPTDSLPVRQAAAPGLDTSPKTNTRPWPFRASPTSTEPTLRYRRRTTQRVF